MEEIIDGMKIYMKKDKPLFMSISNIFDTDIKETIIYLQKIANIADRYNMVVKIYDDYGALDASFIEKGE